MVRFTLDPRRPPRLDAAGRALLEARSDAVLTAAAADADNPPLTAAERTRLRAARLGREVRAGTGLSQARFATAYRINLARLRDLEQGRTQADSALLAYLAVIAREQKAVARALGRGEAT